MNTAHIIIQIMESPDGSDMQVNLSFSGGADLQKPESQTAFADLLSNIENKLQENQIT